MYQLIIAVSVITFTFYYLHCRWRYAYTVVALSVHYYCHWEDRGLLEGKLTDKVLSLNYHSWLKSKGFNIPLVEMHAALSELEDQSDVTLDKTVMNLRTIQVRREWPYQKQ